MHSTRVRTSPLDVGKTRAQNNGGELVPFILRIRIILEVNISRNPTLSRIVDASNIEYWKLSGFDEN